MPSSDTPLNTYCSFNSLCVFEYSSGSYVDTVFGLRGVSAQESFNPLSNVRIQIPNKLIALLELVM